MYNFALCPVSSVTGIFAEVVWLGQEIVFSALAESGPQESTQAEFLQRMAVEVFKGNMDQFRYANSSILPPMC